VESIEPAPTYELWAERLLETRRGGFYDWPVQMAEKKWVDTEAFMRRRAHLATINVFWTRAVDHLRLLNRAKASPQDEKAVEVPRRHLQRHRFRERASIGARIRAV
jgi:hypothetical protein